MLSFQHLSPLPKDTPHCIDEYTTACDRQTTTKPPKPFNTTNSQNLCHNSAIMSNTYRRPTSNPHSKFGAAARPSPRPERSVREGRSSYDVSLSPPSPPLHNSGTAIAEEFRDFIEEYDLRTEGASGFGPMLSDSPLEGGRSTQPKKRRRTRDAGLQVGEKDSVVAIDGYATLTSFPG